MNLIKNVIRKIFAIFQKETITMDDLNKQNQYIDLLNKHNLLKKENDELKSEYDDLKEVLFSPLHTSADVDNSKLLNYASIGISVVILLIK
jgi:cell shape-determining protein MreC